MFFKYRSRFDVLLNKTAAQEKCPPLQMFARSYDSGSFYPQLSVFPLKTIPGIPLLISPFPGIDPDPSRPEEPHKCSHKYFKFKAKQVHSYYWIVPPLRKNLRPIHITHSSKYFTGATSFNFHNYHPRQVSAFPPLYK